MQQHDFGNFLTIGENSFDQFTPTTNAASMPSVALKTAMPETEAIAKMQNLMQN
jgi:hypothetical protein